MLKRKIIIVCLIGAIILSVIVFKSGTGIKLKEAINYSLQEDFKIKESLGQIFLIEDEGESTSVSGDILVSSINKPVDAVYSVNRTYGEVQYVFECERYVSIKATADGKIEGADGEKVTLRHSDGKLSVYYNATCYLRQGDQVKKGECIGYANGNITYKLYDNCVALDAGEYFS